MADETPPPPDGTPGEPAPKPPSIPARLPDDHPLVAAYGRVKAKLAEREDAEKTELQKLQDALNERDEQLQSLPEKVRGQAIRFASTATQIGFLDPEDALVLVGDVDLADNDAVKTALEDLAERKPHLVRSDRSSPKVAERPKPKTGERPVGDEGDGLTGKERAALAMRGLRTD